MSKQTSSSASIALNAEQAGQNTAWVHLVPAGEFTGIDGRGPYKLTNAETVIGNSREKTGKRQIVIDYEHQTVYSKENGKSAPAAGWIIGMEARPDGIWGLVEWTEAASAHIAKREYRYISPVFSHSKTGEVIAVLNASLTNSPNLDQLVALNRAEATMENEQLKSKLKSAGELLGLGGDASQEDIMAKLRELTKLASELATLTGVTDIAANSAIPDPAKYVPIGDFERVVKDANSLRQGVTESVALNRVNEDVRSGKLAPMMKDWAISLCTSNMPAYDGFMERVGPAFAGILKPSGASAHTPQHVGKSTVADDQELAICAQMGLSPEEYAKAR